MKLIIGLGILVLMSACGLFPGIDAAVDGPPPPFDECRAERYAFIGESSLAALGLDDFGGPEANRVGTIWVTADEVVLDMGPVPPGEAPFVQEPSRMMCAEWEDGSGMAAPIADDWQRPVATSVATGTSPVAPVIVVIMLITLIGASLVAFRRERPTGV
jgi:hypothetical protein